MKMIVGVLSLEIFLPSAHSLKDKRQHLKSFKDRVRKKYNVSLAEVDFQDKWQRAAVGIAAINSRRRIVEEILTSVLRDAEQSLEGMIVSHRIDYL